MIQKEKIWKDAKGQQVPIQYISKYDVVKEKTVGMVFNKLTRLQQQVFDLKRKLVLEMSHCMSLSELDNKDWKTALVYSFDRSIKIEYDREKLQIRCYMADEKDPENYSLLNIDFQNAEKGKLLKISRPRKKKQALEENK